VDTSLARTPHQIITYRHQVPMTCDMRKKNLIRVGKGKSLWPNLAIVPRATGSDQKRPSELTGSIYAPARILTLLLAFAVCLLLGQLGLS
jgi:hypothetical protein